LTVGGEIFHCRQGQLSLVQVLFDVLARLSFHRLEFVESLGDLLIDEPPYDRLCLPAPLDGRLGLGYGSHERVKVVLKSPANGRGPTDDSLPALVDPSSAVVGNLVELAPAVSGMFEREAPEADIGAAVETVESQFLVVVNVAEGRSDSH
jgi:hypothetical protein